MSFIKTSCYGAICSITSMLPVILLVFGVTNTQAQQRADTADKIKIVIANTGAIEHYQTDTGSFNKFVNDVVVYQGTDTLYCDSLFQYIEGKRLEAFSNVRIAQAGGTEGTCNHLIYMSEKKLAYMTGDVSLIDGNNKLWCEELNYNLGTKVGIYNKNGTLQSDSTIVSSISGIYNVPSHDARFTGNVIVNDPRYKISSKDLGYNTETKVETFYDYSIVTTDSGKSILTTKKGTYDSKHVTAHFTGFSSIWSDGQYIEADSMHYDKNTGYGYAIGNVISTDTTNHTTIYCGRADYFRKKRILWATIKPVLELATAKDTFYMRADTFYSAPMIRVKGKQFRMPLDTNENTKDTLTAKTTKAQPTVDSTVSSTTGKTGKRNRNKKQKTDIDTVATTLINTTPKTIDSMWAVPRDKYTLVNFAFDTALAKHAITLPKQPKKKKLQPEPVVDSSVADTTSPIFFTGYHHVLIFSDSMQAKCDSVCFTRSDSIVHMLYAPVAWARGSQINGDTILMQLNDSSIRSMYIPEDAFVASRSGPEKAQLFDQVQGKTLVAFFKGNNIHKMTVAPEAETIYYSKDDAGAYLGVIQANSELIRVFFGEDNINTIKLIKDVHKTMTPLDKADLPNTRLSRFKWLYDQRPASREQLFK